MERRKRLQPAFSLRLRCTAEEGLRLAYQSGEEAALQLLPGLTHEYVMFWLEVRFRENGIRMPYRKKDRRAQRDFALSDHPFWLGADKALRMLATQIFRARFAGYHPHWERDVGHCLLLNVEPVNLVAIGRSYCRFSWHRPEGRSRYTITFSGEAVEVACPEDAPELPETLREGMVEFARLLILALPPLKRKPGPQQLELFDDSRQDAQR